MINFELSCEKHQKTVVAICLSEECNHGLICCSCFVEDKIDCPNSVLLEDLLNKDVFKVLSLPCFQMWKHKKILAPLKAAVSRPNIVEVIEDKFTALLDTVVEIVNKKKEEMINKVVNISSPDTVIEVLYNSLEVAPLIEAIREENAEETSKYVEEKRMYCSPEPLFEELQDIISQFKGNIEVERLISSPEALMSEVFSSEMFDSFFKHTITSDLTFSTNFFEDYDYSKVSSKKAVSTSKHKQIFVLEQEMEPKTGIFDLLIKVSGIKKENVILIGVGDSECKGYCSIFRDNSFYLKSKADNGEGEAVFGVRYNSWENELAPLTDNFTSNGKIKLKSDNFNFFVACRQPGITFMII